MPFINLLIAAALRHHIRILGATAGQVVESRDQALVSQDLLVLRSKPGNQLLQPVAEHFLIGAGIERKSMLIVINTESAGRLIEAQL